MTGDSEHVPVCAMGGVWFGYGRVPVLRGLNLTVAPGTAVALIGPNGCGKTTTLHVLSGLLRASRGTVAIAGRGVPGRPEEVNALLAYVPDTPTGFEHLAVSEYARLVGAVHRADTDYARRVRDLVRILALEPYISQPLGTLSYGTRRKVALVAAAALDRPLLMLDEATNGLDPESVNVVEKLVRSIVARGRGVLVATQDVYFAERTCDEVALLRDGRVVISGLVSDVKRERGAATLRDVFLAATGLDVEDGALDAALARADAR